LGSIAQIFYPKKQKIAKYAANFDFSSKQPLFNRLQRNILNNTILTRNIQMLVYGNWPQATKNCLPFFTASYFEKDKEPTPPRILTKDTPIKLLYVGTLRSNKKPLLSIQVCERLRKEGFQVTLDLYGDGPERKLLENYIVENRASSFIQLHGNQSKETVKSAFQTSHFLIFISKSEGWPKDVAESMFWGCLPITTAVSMVPEMIGNKERGVLIHPNLDEVVDTIKSLINSPAHYSEIANNAMAWSREFTFDKFEEKLRGLMENDSTIGK
jgi:glycosyltransferase involved in cell wall biosynthesis